MSNLGKYGVLGNLKGLFSMAQSCPGGLPRVCRGNLNFSSTTSAATGGDCASVAREGRFFPRRAMMYVPACDERKTSKAASLKVDSIVFDIEDGVAVNQKAR